MLQTVKVNVSGLKRFKDTVDGKPYDTTKAFIVTPLDSSREQLIKSTY